MLDDAYKPAPGAAGASDRIEVPSAQILAQGQPKVPANVFDLNSGKVRALHRELFGHYLRELDTHASNRRQMEKDEAYYDHEQWEPEDIAILQARGQEPLVMNVIAQSINWIMGTERRGRTDGKVLPRVKEGSRAAENKSHVLKYVADANRSEFHNSRAFADTVKAGVGWLEAAVQSDSEGEPIVERYESWRNIVWDSAAQEMDLSDARYIFRTKWTDLDTAMAKFPGEGEAATLRMAAMRTYEYGATLDDHGDAAMDSIEEFRDEAYGSGGARSDDIAEPERTRVRLVECWYKKPVSAKRIKGGEFSGELFDSGSLGHYLSVQRGEAEVIKDVTFRTHVMVMTSAGPVWASESPYRHNQYPFTPIWAYRRASNNMPYGVIRGMRDAQRDINKRLSKALSILSSSKVIMDEGAVADLDAFEEEISRPDAVIVKRPGKMLEIGVDRELSAAHLQVMQISMGMIQSLSGVTDESLGRTTNATSGKAIVARQEQGALSTAPIFDNLRLARQIHGEKMLSLIEQFMTEKKQFRITNKRGSADYITINDDLLPDSDIVQRKADFIMSEDSWNASMRQAQADAFMALLAQLAPVAPQVVIVLLDLLVEAMDVPSRDEIVKRIRQQTGAEDPDADPSTPDPERDARNAAKAAQAQLQQRMVMADLAKKEGDAAASQAKALKTGVDARKVLASLPGDDIGAKKAALELAVAMLSAEPALDVADAVHQQAQAAVTPPQPPQQQPQPQPQQPAPQGAPPDMQPQGGI